MSLSFPVSSASSDRSMKDRSIWPLQRYHMGAKPVSPGPALGRKTNRVCPFGQGRSEAAVDISDIFWWFVGGGEREAQRNKLLRLACPHAEP